MSSDRGVHIKLLECKLNHQGNEKGDFTMKKLLFFVIMLLTIQTFALAGSNPLLKYTFDGNTVQGNTVKDIAGKNDGTINGGAKQINNAIEFDGKDGYIVTPALEARIAGKVGFTVIGRFKTNQVPNGPLWMWGDNAKPSSSSAAEGPVGWRTTTKLFAAGFYNNGHFYADAKKDYADNNWHVIAQVGDTAKGYLYVDGDLISETTAGYVYAANPYLLIGARTKNSGSEIDDTEYFKGAIDMILVYTSTLSKDEIMQISKEALSVSPSKSLVAFWGQIKSR